MPKAASSGGKKPASNRKKPKAATSAGPAPTPVKTGKGLTPLQAGKLLVQLFKKNDDAGVQKRLWSPKIESVEGLGVALAWKGARACRAKSDDWMSKHRIHDASADGPYVGATGFAVRFRMDVEVLDTGKRIVMEEVGVYTVQNGKIVREEFMYGLG